jgi:hypothetical protein
VAAAGFGAAFTTGTEERKVVAERTGAAAGAGAVATAGVADSAAGLAADWAASSAQAAPATESQAAITHRIRPAFLINASLWPFRRFVTVPV